MCHAVQVMQVGLWVGDRTCGTSGLRFAYPYQLPTVCTPNAGTTTTYIADCQNNSISYYVNDQDCFYSPQLVAPFSCTPNVPQDSSTLFFCGDIPENSLVEFSTGTGCSGASVTGLSAQFTAVIDACYPFPRADSIPLLAYYMRVSQKNITMQIYDNLQCSGVSTYTYLGPLDGPCTVYQPPTFPTIPGGGVAPAQIGYRFTTAVPGAHVGSVATANAMVHMVVVALASLVTFMVMV